MHTVKIIKTDEVTRKYSTRPRCGLSLEMLKMAWMCQKTSKPRVWDIRTAPRLKGRYA